MNSGFVVNSVSAYLESSYYLLGIQHVLRFVFCSIIFFPGQGLLYTFQICFVDTVYLCQLEVEEEVLHFSDSQFFLCLLCSICSISSKIENFGHAS